MSTARSNGVSRRDFVKVGATVTAALGAASLVGCGSQGKSSEPGSGGSREFTDDCGRTVSLPAVVEAFLPAGPAAQTILFAFDPEGMVGLTTDWDAATKEIFDTEKYEVPYVGALYGGKEDISPETVIELGPEVIIDIGEAKSTIVEDLDALQEKVGIPFVHIDAHLARMDECYARIAELFGRNEDEAATLGAYCAEAYKSTTDIMAKVTPLTGLYCLGDLGINVIAKGSYHSEVLDLCFDNLAVIENPAAKGTGNEVDMEQLYNWDPEVIVFGPGSVYSAVGSDENWLKLKAIANGAYCETPNRPYNWLGFPPSVQRVLGLLWLPKVLYPEAATYDLYEKVSEYFDLFFHTELSKEKYQEIVANSLPA